MHAQTHIIGASLSEPHTDQFRFCRVYIYMRRMYGLPYISICRMDKMAALCVALCVRLKYSPRTASNEKEIVRHEADTPTSHPGKDIGIVRRNSAN